MNIEKEISFLTLNHDQPLNTNKKGLKKRLKRFLNYYNNASNEQKNTIRDLVYQEPRPSEIHPNTVGSFLFGCQQGIYGEKISKNNSVLCSNGIGYDPDKSNIQIWYQNSNLPTRFRQINYPVESEKAYIFVKEDFEKFTIEEIKMFRNYDVKKGSLFKTKSSKHFLYEDCEDIQLDDFPLISGKFTIKDDKNTDKTQNGGILFIILTLVVILIIFCFKKVKINP